MSGTKKGGLQAAETNKQLYGKDFYSKLGKKGGAVEHPETRAFNTNRKLASEAGYKGGSVTGANYKTRRNDATV